MTRDEFMKAMGNAQANVQAVTNLQNDAPAWRAMAKRLWQTYNNAGDSDAQNIADGLDDPIT